MLWPPAQFWAASLSEVIAAIAGYNRAQGGGVPPLARARFDALLEAHGAPSPSIRKKD